ncbi:unnamed protein product [Lepeophtheirus salmonis]|uniref:(salmon louse) hypothetical protein n=1 Tax=Lepeophtheirus salmonis TaxID=72036 RepID=A0A7R8GZU9_LEPSM|nr:unnamed protein product [Lepeophtheirus salmonis]CAF2773935.1 unnamed protein product [Lepeophtheirus salmonis]
MSYSVCNFNTESSLQKSILNILCLLRVDPDSFLNNSVSSQNNSYNDLDLLNDHGQMYTRYEDRPYLFGRGRFWIRCFSKTSSKVHRPYVGKDFKMKYLKI